jgi:hypothetical protein
MAPESLQLPAYQSASTAGFGGPVPGRNQCFQPCSLFGAMPPSLHVNKRQKPEAVRLSYTWQPLTFGSACSQVHFDRVAEILRPYR